MGKVVTSLRQFGKDHHWEQRCVERRDRRCIVVYFCLLWSSLSSLSLRYKNVERLAAEEFEREHVRVSRTRPDLNLTFEPSEAWPSSSRSSTPSSFASQEDAEADLEAQTSATPYTPSETGRTTENTVWWSRCYIMTCYAQYWVITWCLCGDVSY